MKDIHSDLNIQWVLGPIVASADNTPVSIDLQGYNAAEIVLGVGIGGISFDATNKIEFKVTHSDDDVTFDPVTVSDVLGVPSVGAGGIVKALTAAHGAAAVYRIGYKGGRRYLRWLNDFSGTHGTGTPLFVGVIRGHGYNNPQANQI